MSVANGSNGHHDFVFSTVRGIKDDFPADTTFSAFMAGIRDGKWKSLIVQLRSVHADASARATAEGLIGKAFDDAVKNVVRPLKTRLPGACFSGTFSYRDAEHLIAPSGLICADLDHLNERVESVRDLIAADPHTLGCAISPSGTGLKVIFRIDPARPHLESFYAAEHYVREHFGEEIDGACKEINRLCFVTYDPDAFIAADALVLPYPPPPEPTPTSPPEYVPSLVRRNSSAGYISALDDYNARDDFLGELRADGWTAHNDNTHFWCRPGVTDHQGATWDTQPAHPRKFHVFTSSVPSIPPGNYSPVAVYAWLRCGGGDDFERVEDELYWKGFGTRIPRRIPKAEQARLDAKAEASSALTPSTHIFPGDRFMDDGKTSQRNGALEVYDPGYEETTRENGQPPEFVAVDGGNVAVAPKEDEWPEPVRASELCANPPPKPPVLIEGILYSGGTMLLAGPSKSHKTFSALDAAIAIASGTPWLGFKTTQATVLYLNLELQDFATEERIAKISSARGGVPPNELVIWNLRGRTISIAALTVKLPAMIRKFGATFVAIDPHYKVSAVSDMEENSNDSQGKLLTLLEGLCSKEKSALALTHHFAKGDASAKNAIDRASGGGVFARWGDVMLTFTPHEEDDAMSVEMSLRNFAPVKPFVVRWEYPRWVRDTALDPANLKSNRGAKEKHTPDSALHCLGDKLLTFSEWHKATGMSESTFRRKRQELLDSGAVVQQGVCYRAKK